MIVQFSCKNFKSIQNTVTLSFLESNITEFPDSIYRSEENSYGLLPVVTIYGPNGGGKSNLLEALAFLKSTSLPSFLPVPSFDQKAASSKLPSEFQITFQVQGLEYSYQLSLLKTTILEETLLVRTLLANHYDVLFDRDEEGVFLGEPLENLNIETLSDHQTMLSFLGDTGMENEAQNVLLFFDSLVVHKAFEDDFSPVVWLLDQPSYKKRFLHYAAEFGIPLSSLTISADHKEIFLFYKNGPKRSFFTESSGNRRILLLLASFLLAEHKKVPLVLDDMNTFLHPKAVQHFFDLLTTKTSAPITCQLICTLTDMALMSPKYLRRDEIYLCSQPDKDGTILYCLAEYLKENGEKVRKDETYFKQYLEGRYESLPYPR